VRKKLFEKKKALIAATSVAIALVFAVSSFGAIVVTASSSTSDTFFHVSYYSAGSYHHADHWQVQVCLNSNVKCSSKYTNSAGNTGYFVEPSDSEGTAKFFHNGYECAQAGVYFLSGKVEFVEDVKSSATQCK
jgi:hypothetical protein